VLHFRVRARAAGLRGPPWLADLAAALLGPLDAALCVGAASEVVAAEPLVIPWHGLALLGAPLAARFDGGEPVPGGGALWRWPGWFGDARDPDAEHSWPWGDALDWRLPAEARPELPTAIYFTRDASRFFAVPEGAALPPGGDWLRRFRAAPVQADTSAMDQWAIPRDEAMARAKASLAAADGPLATFETQILALQEALRAPEAQETLTRVTDRLRAIGERARARRLAREAAKAEE